jgi:hypothetical protein
MLYVTNKGTKNYLQSINVEMETFPFPQEAAPSGAVSIPTSILTLERAARVLDCNPFVLAKRLKMGEIRGYKKGKRWYLLHEDLVAWVKGGGGNAM